MKPKTNFDIMEANIKAQKDISLLEFKRDAKRSSLRAALDNKPRDYDRVAQQQLQSSGYNLLLEAEKIYQWLIKI